MGEALLKVRGLKTYFYTEEGVVPSVDGIDFDLQAGKTLAIVGESGCGKSVTSLSVMGLLSKPGKVVEGQILFRGGDIVKKSEKEMRAIRGNEISMIFQEPMTSLNPVFPVGKQIMDAFRIHRGLGKKQAAEQTVAMIRKVGIPSPEKVARQYPHELSGGMRQRIMIAMALACSPKILIADEPTTALDVTIQAQILRLIAELKEETGTSVVLITHDLGVVAQIAEDVIVMYAGQVVEQSPVKPLFKQPLHPYTVGLLKSVPQINQRVDSLYSIEGAVPNPYHFPAGCRFCPRCALARPICQNRQPALIQLDATRQVRCWKYDAAEGRQFE